MTRFLLLPFLILPMLSFAQDAIGSDFVLNIPVSNRYFPGDGYKIYVMEGNWNYGFSIVSLNREEEDGERLPGRDFTFLGADVTYNLPITSKIILKPSVGFGLIDSHVKSSNDIPIGMAVGNRFDRGKSGVSAAIGARHYLVTGQTNITISLCFRILGGN